MSSHTCSEVKIMKLSDAQIYSITAYFADKPVKKAYVFGSYARGDADEGSDIDLVVELDYDISIGLKFFIMQDELQDLVKTPVDLVSANSLSPHVRPFVDTENDSHL